MEMHLIHFLFGVPIWSELTENWQKKFPSTTMEIMLIVAVTDKKLVALILHSGAIEPQQVGAQREFAFKRAPVSPKKVENDVT